MTRGYRGPPYDPHKHYFPPTGKKPFLPYDTDFDHIPADYVVGLLNGQNGWVELGPVGAGTTDNPLGRIGQNSVANYGGVYHDLEQVADVAVTVAFNGVDDYSQVFLACNPTGTTQVAASFRESTAGNFQMQVGGVWGPTYPMDAGTAAFGVTVAVTFQSDGTIAAYLGSPLGTKIGEHVFSPADMAHLTPDCTLAGFSSYHQIVTHFFADVYP